MYVTVLGNLLLEFTLKLKKIPSQTSDHQNLFDFLVNAGGSANTIIVGQRLGITMKPLANVGDDLFGTQIISALENEGVATENILKIANERTTTVFTLVEDTGKYTFLSYPGTRGTTLLPKTWRRTIQEASGIFLSGWTYRNMHPDVVTAAVKATASKAVPLFFDPGPDCINIPSKWINYLLSRTEVLLVTEEEAKELLKLHDNKPLEKIAALLHQRGPKLVVIKRGASGVCISTGDRIEAHPGFKVDVQDTTGAGDSLAAAIIRSYLHNHSLAEMTILANATGAAAVQKLGTGQSLPQRYEIHKILEGLPSFSYLL